jgi:hypothetical protein
MGSFCSKALFTSGHMGIYHAPFGDQPSTLTIDSGGVVGLTFINNMGAQNPLAQSNQRNIASSLSQNKSSTASKTKILKTQVARLNVSSFNLKKKLETQAKEQRL